MQTSGEGDVVVTESQKVWREVQEFLRNEDFEKAIQLCNTIRSKSPDDLDAIRTKCLCLINQDKYEKALQSSSGKHKAVLSPERAYCLFRLGRLEEALEVARGGRSSVDGGKRASALRHLEAQALYRLGHHADAADVYADIYEQGEGEGGGSFPAVSVNLAAAHAAAGHEEKALEAFHPEDAMEEEGAPWELLYNLGTALLQRGAAGDAATAEKCLEQAGEVCREGLVAMGQSEAGAADEASMIMSQLAFAQGGGGKYAAAAERLKQIVRSRPSDPAVSLVSTANLAALGGYKDPQEALKRLRSAMSEKAEKGLLSRGLEACRFNKCLLLLQCGKTEECHEELEAVMAIYPASDLGPRIEAALLSKRGKNEEASKVLETRLSQAKKGSDEEVSLKLTIAQLYAVGGDLALAAQTLEGVKAVTGTPAAASALARLYAGMGDAEKGAAVVVAAAESAHRGEHGLHGEDKAKALLGMADWLQGEGFHRRAAETYSKLLGLGAELDGDMRVQAQASLVIAYSYFDSEKSEEEASRLPYNEDLGSSEGMDPLELEMTELPRSTKDFPYYYDRCHSCDNSEGNTFVGYVYPTARERASRAGRTEVYHCPSCGAVSRFARYAAVSKVLETRRGRCGEYSVLMLRLLEALGFVCRWVVDWSDHVWVEARVAGRWVHVDPCEAAVDEPLLYESWGKKQTYIIAFTQQEVVDVTENYTSDMEGARARRDIDQSTMEALIADATKSLQQQEQESP